MPFRHKLTDQERANLLTWAAEGYGHTQIANLLGNKISKQRVEQICKKHRINATTIKRQKRQQELENRMFRKWGPRWKDQEWRKTAIYKAMKEKFKIKKANSVRRGIDFTVDFCDVEFPTHCPVFGIELDYFTDQGFQDNSPSFDRIDTTKGYIKGNVSIISMKANRIKNNGTAKEHRLIADFIDSVLQRPLEG